MEAGIIDKWTSFYHKEFFSTTPCQEEQQNAQPIIAANIVGPMIALAVGSALSLVVLIVEIARFRYTVSFAEAKRTFLLMSLISRADEKS